MNHPIPHQILSLHNAARSGKRGSLLLVAFVTMFFGVVSAAAQTYSVLYTFTGGADGGGPDLEQLVKIGGAANNNSVFPRMN